MSKTIVQTVVHLKVYKGKELNYNASGEPKNENQLVKLIYDTLSYQQFMNNLNASGYCHAELVGVYNNTINEKNESKLDKIVSENLYDEISIKIGTAFHGDKFHIEYKAKKEKSKAENENNDNEEAIKARYTELTGNKPGIMKVGTLKRKIAEIEDK